MSSVSSKAGEHWDIEDESVLDAVPANKYNEFLVQMRKMVVANDMLDNESQEKLSTYSEVQESILPLWKKKNVRRLHHLSSGLEEARHLHKNSKEEI